MRFLAALFGRQAAQDAIASGEGAIAANYHGSGNQYVGLTGKDIDAIADRLWARQPPGNATAGLPGARQEVAEAVRSVAEGAEAGDERLRQALDLLSAGQAEAAIPLLQGFAEAKKARIAQDRKAAAQAYKNLGAIAGLTDPKRALDAYEEAIALDPDDLDCLLWAAYLAKDRGALKAAEPRFRAILARNNAGPGTGNGHILDWGTLRPHVATLATRL